MFGGKRLFRVALTLAVTVVFAACVRIDNSPQQEVQKSQLRLGVTDVQILRAHCNFVNGLLDPDDLYCYGTDFAVPSLPGAICSANGEGYQCDFEATRGVRQVMASASGGAALSAYQLFVRCAERGSFANPLTLQCETIPPETAKAGYLCALSGKDFSRAQGSCVNSVPQAFSQKKSLTSLLLSSCPTKSVVSGACTDLTSLLGPSAPVASPRPSLSQIYFTVFSIPTPVQPISPWPCLYDETDSIVPPEPGTACIPNHTCATILEDGSIKYLGSKFVCVNEACPAGLCARCFTTERAREMCELRGKRAKWVQYPLEAPPGYCREQCFECEGQDEFTCGERDKIQCCKEGQSCMEGKCTFTEEYCRQNNKGPLCNTKCCEPGQACKPAEDLAVGAGLKCFDTVESCAIQGKGDLCGKGCCEKGQYCAAGTCRHTDGTCEAKGLGKAVCGGLCCEKQKPEDCVEKHGTFGCLAAEQSASPKPSPTASPSAPIPSPTPSPSTIPTPVPSATSVPSATPF